MKKLKNLKDLLCHEVQALYSAEELLVSGIKRMFAQANNLELKAAFQQHLEETKIHIERLLEVSRILNIDPEGDSNPAMKGLIAEGEKAMDKESNAETMDAALIVAAQKIEHYEIAGYGSATYYAEELGLYDVANLLQKTLAEEKATDKKLNMLAKDKINAKVDGMLRQ
jgi:ferritin-like metal-binding protein YciE